MPQSTSGRVSREKRGRIMLIGPDRVAKRDQFDAHEAHRLGLVQVVLASADAQEGLRAMLERRPGDFKGR